MRRRKSKNKIIILSLTSLIDVFIILLIFLLKHYSLRPDMGIYMKDLQLPISTAIKAPESAAIITATNESILLNGHHIKEAEVVLKQKELLVEELYTALVENKKHTLHIASLNPSVIFSGKIIIQADKRIPYAIIKKLIYTCGKAEFGEISLHVIKKIT
ncbi:MAG: ExbD/TolR family protein [bacterium]